MVLELHVWGPAFSLPSLDSHCIAAVAYFAHALPRGAWTLVASSPELTPPRALPALRHAAGWVAGFANIVDFVAQLSGGAWALDAGLGGEERADLIAFSAFVESQGQDLLDLSLYVSSENYNAVTRPLFSTVQSFPLSWIAPQKLRAAAKARTAHLGLSALDIDTDSAAPTTEDPSIVPESLRRPAPPTVTSLLAARPESAAQIRLAGLATAFFAPLQRLRDQRRFFVADRPTSLDCLALGYLALALFPDLPSPWLAEGMRRDFPQLCAFVHDAQRLFFGGAVAPADAWLEGGAPGKGGLPWTRGETGGLLAVGGALAAHVADAIPGVGQLLRARRMQEVVERAAEEDPEAGDELALAQHRIAARRREVYVAVGSVVAGLGLFVGFVLQQGILGALGGGRVDGEGFDGEGKEGDGGWNTTSVEPGVAALAQQMDFLSDLQFGNPQGGGDIAPEGVI